MIFGAQCKKKEVRFDSRSGIPRTSSRCPYHECQQSKQGLLKDTDHVANDRQKAPSTCSHALNPPSFLGSTARLDSDANETEV